MNKDFPDDEGHLVNIPADQKIEEDIDSPIQKQKNIFEDRKDSSFVSSLNDRLI